MEAEISQRKHSQLLRVQRKSTLMPDIPPVIQEILDQDRQNDDLARYAFPHASTCKDHQQQRASQYDQQDRLGLNEEYEKGYQQKESDCNNQENIIEIRGQYMHYYREDGEYSSCNSYSLITENAVILDQESLLSLSQMEKEQEILRRIMNNDKMSSINGGTGSINLLDQEVEPTQNIIEEQEEYFQAGNEEDDYGFHMSSRQNNGHYQTAQDKFMQVKKVIYNIQRPKHLHQMDPLRKMTTNQYNSNPTGQGHSSQIESQSSSESGQLLILKEQLNKLRIVDHQNIIKIPVQIPDRHNSNVSKRRRKKTTQKEDLSEEIQINEEDDDEINFLKKLLRQITTSKLK